MSFYQLEILTK